MSSDRLCEGDCTLNDGHGAITIGAIETFISEGFKKGLTPSFSWYYDEEKKWLSSVQALLNLPVRPIFLELALL